MNIHLSNLDLELNSASKTTQRSTTRYSYEKVANLILSNYPKVKSILDFGAGKGEGTPILRTLTGMRVESYEPFPSGYSPDYTKFMGIRGVYDVVVCLNVLNVLPPALRVRAVKQIFMKLAPGGVAFISTRGWRGDIDQTKKYTLVTEEDKAIIVQNTGAYQKGFDDSELAEYVRGIITGDVVQAGSKFGKTCIIIKKR